MQKVRLFLSQLSRSGLALAVAAGFGLAAQKAVAQPANDSFLAAEELVGVWGSVSNDLADATAEIGEPIHAGIGAMSSVWYKWYASFDGEVTLDTHGSVADTLLGVYTGSSVDRLTQIAANDDAYPAPQNNINGRSMITQPYIGPSQVRFNAKAGTWYYFAVDAYPGFGPLGPQAITLSWAYASSGVFRFATENYGQLQEWEDPDGLGSSLLYEVSEMESSPRRMDRTTLATYYMFDVPAALVSVTRVAGSSGRAVVHYETTNITAVPFTDYMPVSGDLVFDDYEMTKTIQIPIMSDFGTPNTNRAFAVLLSQAALDPDESADVSAPRIDPFFGRAVVRILDADIDPVYARNFDTNDMFTGPSNSVFNFCKSFYRVAENSQEYWGSRVTLYVARHGTNREAVTLNYRVLNFLGSDDGASEYANNIFPLCPGSDYATPTPPNAANISGRNPDFNMVEGTVSWGQNDFQPKPISFDLFNDTIPEFNEDFRVYLFELVNGVPRTVGLINETTVTILADDEDIRAGSVDQLHNPDYGLEMAPPIPTVPPNQDRPGADSPVYGIALQGDGKPIIVGEFTSYNGVARNRITRVNLDGSVDLSFDPGSGTDALISSVAITPQGGILVAGAFSSYNSISRNNIARVAANGALDPAFDPGVGADGMIWAMVQQGDGKVIVAGEFRAINNVPCYGIGRLNTDGSVDTNFNSVAASPNAAIKALALDASGKIMIGGDFTRLGATTWNHLARLNDDGTVDNSLSIGTGTDSSVFALAVESSGRILVGGAFQHYNEQDYNRIVRLNANGTVDNTFVPGVAANGTVYAIAPQSSGLIYVGGIFTSFNGTRRAGLTRLFRDGTVDTSFLDPAYNQFAGLPSHYYDSVWESRPYIYSVAVQGNGDVLIGGGFERVGGGQFNASTQPADLNELTEPKARNGIRNRSNFARLHGGATPGPGNLSLLYTDYQVNRKQSFLYVSLIRENGYLGNLSANFALDSGQSVQSGLDYQYNAVAPKYLNGWSGTRMHSDGLFGTNTLPIDSFDSTYLRITEDKVIVNILNSGIPGNIQTDFRLSNPSGADLFFLGGENIPLGSALGRSSANFRIVDDTRFPGVLGFSQGTFTVSETSTNVVLSVTRTNGSDGVVTVQYRTTDGTAKAGTHYKSKSGSLTFNPGVTSQTIAIDLIDESITSANDLGFTVSLSSPSGGATISAAQARVVIVDNDSGPGRLNFSAASYATNEAAPVALLQVNRNAGSLGILTGTIITLNGTGPSGAIAGQHYTAVTNVLQWNSGEITPKFVAVPLIDNALVGPASRTFTAYITNLTAGSTVGTQAVTTVSILEDDAYGSLAFNASSYLVAEQAGSAIITVTRTAGIAEDLTVAYATTDGTAVSSGVSPNFVATSGTLSFAPGEVAKSFTVPILNDGSVNTEPFFFTVGLSSPTPAGILGTPNPATVTIVDAQSVNEPAGSVDTAFVPTPGFNGDVYNVSIQPDGKILTAGNFTMVNSVPYNRIARLRPNGSLDTEFLAGLSGASGAINSMLLQTDGRIVLGGAFVSVNGINRNRIARLLGDGTMDSSFNPGAAFDNTVYTVVESFVNGTRRLLVGGSFNTINSLSRPALVRLNNDGSLDSSFNPSLAINGTVYSLAVYPTNTLQAGKILVGGDFTSINGTGHPRLVRLNVDGTIDPTFNIGTGASDTVRALTIQFDGKVLVGGSFTNFNGTTVNYLTRLNVDGSRDLGFNSAPGTDGPVEDILVQPDTRIILVGQFTRASGVSRGRITRLMPDGTVDPAINFGTGANSFVQSVALQADGKMVIGGGFSDYDGAPRQRLARVYGGAIAGSGSLEFAASDFVVDENGTNGVVVLRRRGGTQGIVGADFAITDNTAIAGINYSNVSRLVSFPVGETFQSVPVPVRDDLQITTDRVADLSINGVTGGATLGNQPIATLTIRNVDSAISFSSTEYTRNENPIDGTANISVMRQGSVQGTASVDFLTTTNGTAIPGLHFSMVTNTVVFDPGVSNVVVKVPLLHDPTAQGNRTVPLVLTNVLNSLLVTPSEATLTIIDVDQAPGQLFFVSTNYVVNEGDPLALLTVTRTNGSAGVVTVNFNTVPGTAIPGVKYGPTNGILTFAPGEISKTIGVRLVQNNTVEGHQTFAVALSNPGGGAVLLANSTASVTILDDDVGVSFVNPIYAVNELGGSVMLGVQRIGTNGVTTVNYSTTNITALAGTNYQATTGTLTFTNGEALKTFSISIVDDPRVTGDVSFQVALNNPSAPAQLFSPSTATVVVVDSDPGIAFTNANFSVLKSGTNVLISVLRSNANTGVVSVNFGTTNGTALAGVDYTPTNGVLWFSNGIALQSFTVPIINNRVAQGDRTFTIGLENPTGGAQLIAPSITSVTITDDISGLSFSSPVYSVSEKGVAANVTVTRTGFVNNTVSVNYATADGTAVANANYIPTSGTLVFTNGEVSKTFSVQVINNSVVDGDRTVLLTLASPVGNALLVAPSAATLTILEADGSLVVPAGVALLSESGPVNGFIDTNETVTLQFGLRNAAGTNTANLVATLLATNGVLAPSGSQNYGAMAVHGPAVSRPFTFTAGVTNGQPINATFLLQDGAATSTAVFNFTVGQNTTVYSNVASIVVGDNTNATPYPSSINVSGLAGAIGSVRVTLTNMNHTAPSDMDVLLTAPSGYKTLLMAKAGARSAISRATMTFDQAATTNVPNGQITSGIFKPTSYATNLLAMPVPAPPGPYVTNLSGLSGANPNGTWSLYVSDNIAWDSGVISNGWMLHITIAEPIVASADLAIGMTASEPSIVVSSNLVYTISVTNFGPGSASSVVVSNSLPANAAFVSAVGTQGTTSTNGLGQLFWNVGDLALNAKATLTLTVRPTGAGTVINTATVRAATPDPNPDEDTATVNTLATSPAADLVMGMTSSASPVLLGREVSFTVTLTNLGPATASAVTITNTLPPGTLLVSATPAGYLSLPGKVVFPNLGNLGSGATASATVVLKPTVAGTLTDQAVVSSSTFDPLKGNNNASAKAIVEAMAISTTGGQLKITWPDDGLSYILEATVSLTTPNWVRVTEPAPVLQDGQYSITLPVGSGSQYFRLRTNP